MIGNWIEELVNYGIRTGLTPEEERIYTRNLLLDCMKETDFSCDEVLPERSLPEILKDLLDEAERRGLIEGGVTERDLFDSRLMNCLLPRPSQVHEQFSKKYAFGADKATEWYYDFSRAGNYIRTDRIAKDRKWTCDSPYGTLDITINLSKPEKDPRAIAAAGKQKSSSYPKCLLCQENEGYAGTMTHPARNNHRTIPLTLNGEAWGLQYSPYVYYNEHCIVFNTQHVPMKINRSTFEKLLEFTGLFPHYFLGSNADLPIVGGSILSHDHFQGGHYQFAMERAKIEIPITIPGYEDVEAGIVHWPLSVIRIRHEDPKHLADLAEHILDAWRGYTDEEAGILAETEGEPHNTITPIARRHDEKYELDLTLRNNRTSEEHPLGIFHPHEQWHHIKKENIGLIEVMGLAVLPARLKEELELLRQGILMGLDLEEDPATAGHAAWIREVLPKYGTPEADEIEEILQKEVGIVFTHVLEDAGVYKCTKEGREAFLRFTETL